MRGGCHIIFCGIHYRIVCIKGPSKSREEGKGTSVTAAMIKSCLSCRGKQSTPSCSIIIIIISVIIIFVLLLVVDGMVEQRVLYMEEFKATEEGGEEPRKAHVDDTGGGFGGILGMKVVATSQEVHIEFY